MRPHNDIQPVASYHERRKYVRLNEGAMEVWIRRRRFLKEFIKGEPVQWFNYNQFGMAFASTTHLDVHEEVLVNIKTPSVSLTNLVAVVHNARRQAGTNRYGVQFYFGANSHMQSHETRELLSQIEAQLE